MVSTESETSEFKMVWEGTLEKGVYVLIPSTTGCLFKKRKNQPSSDIHLTDIEGRGKYFPVFDKFYTIIVH